MRSEAPGKAVLRFLLPVILLVLLTGISMVMPAGAGVSAPEPLTAAAIGDSAMLYPGEDLLYEVSYLGIKLGRIRIRTLASDTIGGELRHHAKAHIDTYPSIPFVDLHVIDSTSMDRSFTSKGFHATEQGKDGWTQEALTYDLKADRIIIQRTTHKEMNAPPLGPAKLDTVRILDDAFMDGLSLFFYARSRVHDKARATVPTVVYGKRGMTKLRFGIGSKSEEIDALKDKKIRVVGLDGTAEFKGLYGMTGDFSGWFSDDAAAIPIKAQIGVFIGNVDITLIRWSRRGWTPPFAE